MLNPHTGFKGFPMQECVKNITLIILFFDILITFLKIFIWPMQPWLNLSPPVIVSLFFLPFCLSVSPSFNWWSCSFFYFTISLYINTIKHKYYIATNTVNQHISYAFWWVLAWTFKVLVSVHIQINIKTEVKESLLLMPWLVSSINGWIWSGLFVSTTVIEQLLSC